MCRFSFFSFLRIFKMAAKTKTKEEVNVTTAEVVDSTLDQEPEQVEESSETIAIACSLPFGLKFDDVPCGNGATKTVIFPGINSGLKGKNTGVLALPGNAICVTLLKRDWEAIHKMHGNEIAFTGRNGKMPCIYPVGDKKGFKSAASEIAEMRNGLEPINPESVGVKESKETKKE